MTSRAADGLLLKKSVAALLGHRELWPVSLRGTRLLQSHSAVGWAPGAAENAEEASAQFDVLADPLV